jgi:phosphoribosylaminoimidazolecarboxamide formyltransferase/IMP cyclohydrolase
MARVGRALLSTWDRTGLVEFAQRLGGLGITLISSGGTARHLRAGGLRVAEVSEVTGFPEMLDGRVKTLHPKIHGGILAVRDNPQHQQALAAHGIEPIDLVVVNLYPFREVLARGDATREEIIENIDIGGPTLVRAAAKNYAYVGIVVDPADYPAVARELEENEGQLSDATRATLARKAFEHTAAYDAAIAEYFRREFGG